MNKEEMKKKYKLLKKAMDTVRSDITLAKYKILSEAYILGKKIYGHEYSYNRLSFDFEVPYTTVKRICALSKANFNTWKLIKAKKVSSFKVAQILQQHGPTYQDEIIEMVITNDLSTYEIREFRSESLDDIKKMRLKVAVNKGFARQSVAYKSFDETIDRLLMLITIEKEKLPIKRLPELNKKISKLITKLGTFNNDISGVKK